MNLKLPRNDHLNKFENAMYDMIKNTELLSVRNAFQSKLKEIVMKVKSSGKIMVFADKTANVYEMLKEEYAKLINDNVAKMYQKRQQPLKRKSAKK